ncbi:hypothetical protein BH24ACT15_BH24ACT15_31070 [soil metagenome]
MADVAPDVEAVLDIMGVDRVCVGGSSGGGLRALACAALLPNRAIATASLCSSAPFSADGLDYMTGMGEANIAELGLAITGEEALRPFVDEAFAGMADVTAHQLVESLATLLPPVDRACLTGAVGQDFSDDVMYAASGTTDGWVDDDLAFVKPWGFDLDAIEVPLALWHGTADLMVPIAHGRWLSSRLPNAQAPTLRRGRGICR